MDIGENIREGIKSINANKLRTILTASIIAIGITSLVGILTAIEGIQDSINSSFSNLGANTFDVERKRPNRGSRGGKSEKVHPRIKYAELVMFEDKYEGPGTVSINTVVTWTAEAKYGSKISNPNLRVRGGDQDFLAVDGYDLNSGRNFSAAEERNGAFVVIIGDNVKESLFGDNEDPINKKISFRGAKFRVIGWLSEQGGVGGNSGADRTLMIPIETARRIAGNKNLNFEATVSISDPTQMDYATGIATGLMRSIRQDRPGEEDSFQVRVSRSLAERLGEITGYLQIGGFTIGFITLLGASIGLMNIMLVSVTERTREIGVRKALGATPKKIRQQFLIEALVICQMGGAGGIVLGILIGNLVSGFISSGSFIIPWVWILFGVAVGMAVGLISGYLPAFKASRLDPIDSLRFE
ncbi:MAG: ABC transporter permease [Cyclobacteriaceae bacterium]|nr:ABC transporter permease [Cyclobacteriaceae bacterium HetDA_MAG_MS6]